MKETGKAKKLLLYSAEVLGGIVVLWLFGYLIYAFAMA